METFIEDYLDAVKLVCSNKMEYTMMCMMTCINKAKIFDSYVDNCKARLIDANPGIDEKNSQYFSKDKDSEDVMIINPKKNPDTSIPRVLLQFSPTPHKPHVLFEELVVLDMKNINSFYINNHKVLPQELFRAIVADRFTTFKHQMESIVLVVAGVFAKNFYEYNTNGEISNEGHEWWFKGEIAHWPTFVYIIDPSIDYDDEDWVECYNKNKEYFSILETEILKIEKGTLVEYLSRM